MSGQLTLWGSGQILNAYFGREENQPQTFYLALIKDVPPSPYVNGNELDEPASASYARASIPNDFANWGSQGMPNVTVSQEDVVFSECGEDWGQIRFWALCDSEFGGNLYLVGQLENPVVAEAGDQVVVSAGSLSVELGPFVATWEET